MQTMCLHPLLLDTQEVMQLKEIKRLYRLYMNGIVSQSMRQKGAEYRVNFGLTLPLLRRIAEQIPPSAQTAEELWQDRGVRESMLLAPMVYPAEQYTPADAQRWAQEMPNIEVADFCCKYLFSHLPYAPQLVQDWITSPDEKIRYTAFRLSYAIISEKTEQEWLLMVVDNAIPAAYNNNSLSGSAARRFLTEALLMPAIAHAVAERVQTSAIIDNEWRKNILALYDAES